MSGDEPNQKSSVPPNLQKTKFPLTTRRHSAAHILAQAIQRKYPTVKLAIGPDIENGFYYDILVDPPLKAEELNDLEKEMKSIVKERQKFVRYELPVEDALLLLKKSNQPYKVEMAEELKTKGERTISFYKNVNRKDEEQFLDMCAGPHVEHTGELGHFKLTGVAGAYWRGDSSRDQLQRIYGVLFDSDDELKQYEYMIAEAKKRDHRKLGQELEIYTTSEDVGAGLIFWLPRGQIIRDQLENWAKDTEEKWGYQRVTTPMVTREKLFFISEHLPHYTESMFPPMRMDDENYYIKPMNCPFHHTIFGMRPRSYRELPLRLAEYGVCHRFEDSGSLFGLMRVRAMAMNDAHIYCTEEQAVDEFLSVIKLHQYYYEILGIKDYWMVLALRNPENKKYHGDESMWNRAESLTRLAMEKSGVEFVVENDGAAFYGPKVDFQIKSSIGRVFTASTCQLDLFMPGKFDLKYVDKDGTMKQPACIHRSPLGTHERFIGFLLEHFAGAFPVWLTAYQARILPVGEKYHAYAGELKDKMRSAGLRVEIDDTEETLGKKIRNAEKMKIPYMIVVGEKEIASKKLNVRNYFTGEQKEWEFAPFIESIQKEISDRTIQAKTKEEKK